jgi:hypothetical protein
MGNEQENLLKKYTTCSNTPEITVSREPHPPRSTRSRPTWRTGLDEQQSGPYPWEIWRLLAAHAQIGAITDQARASGPVAGKTSESGGFLFAMGNKCRKE